MVRGSPYIKHIIGKLVVSILFLLLVSRIVRSSWWGTSIIPALGGMGAKAGG
jgi:hypothetical protein